MAILDDAHVHAEVFAEKDTDRPRLKLQLNISQSPLSIQSYFSCSLRTLQTL